MIANAVTALALNVAVFLLIGKTSALTMNIAGACVRQGVAGDVWIMLRCMLRWMLR